MVLLEELEPNIPKVPDYYHNLEFYGQLYISIVQLAVKSVKKRR